jgi:hypothetical protein
VSLQGPEIWWGNGESDSVQCAIFAVLWMNKAVNLDESGAALLVCLSSSPVFPAMKFTYLSLWCKILTLDFDIQAVGMPGALHFEVFFFFFFVNFILFYTFRLHPVPSLLRRRINSGVKLTAT